MRFHLPVKSVISLLVFIVISCSTYRHELYSSGGEEEMYRNAIIDFINTERTLLKNNSFFHVFMSPYDSQTVFVFGDDLNKIPLCFDIIDDSSLCLLIQGNGTKTELIDTITKTSIMWIDEASNDSHPRIWINEEYTNKSFRAFPDEVFEYEDKLFFWWYKLKPLKEKPQHVIDAVYRHHYVDTSILLYWPGVIDDERKGKEYIFSKNDLRRYKKKTCY